MKLELFRGGLLKNENDEPLGHAKPTFELILVVSWMVLFLTLQR